MAKYLRPEDLYFELTICKFRGRASDKLSHYFYLIASNLKRKFYIVDFHDDQIQEAQCKMLESFHLVDLDRYEPAGVFAYFSERGKRSYTKIFNIYMDRAPSRWNDVSKLSLTNINSL